MKLRNKKTGEIECVSIDTYGVVGKDRRIGLSVVDFNSPSDYRCIASYSSLVELNEEWEDYQPKEPLIKDKKIRKAVRAWAEANEIVKAFIVTNEQMNWSVYGDDIDRNRFSIEFFSRVVPKENEVVQYTIAELCGEEE